MPVLSNFKIYSSINFPVLKSDSIMIKLEPFKHSDFDTLISWINSEKLLIQIAGTIFSYPLTASQLHVYLDDEKSISFKIVDSSQNKTIGHTEIYLTSNESVKLDKLLIGDKSQRGKGIGQLVVEELLKYSFEVLKAKEVELNVYDWNTAGIKCYEKVGFILNPDKKLSTQVHDDTWLALNMTIDKEKWLKARVRI